MHAHSLTTIVTAGTETSAGAMTGLLYYLTQYPEVNAKLKAEIRSAFKSPKDINLQSCSMLKYLQACIEEVLRLYPPIKIGFPRITPPEGAVIDKQFVPGGVCIPPPYNLSTSLLTCVRLSSTSLNLLQTSTLTTGRTQTRSFLKGGTRPSMRRIRRAHASLSLAVRATA